MTGPSLSVAQSRPGDGSLIKGFQRMIRRSLVRAAFGLALVCAAPAFAQAPALTPGHLQVAREVVDVSADAIGRLREEHDDLHPNLSLRRR